MELLEISLSFCNHFLHPTIFISISPKLASFLSPCSSSMLGFPSTISEKLIVTKFSPHHIVPKYQKFLGMASVHSWGTALSTISIINKNFVEGKLSLLTFYSGSASSLGSSRCPNFNIFCSTSFIDPVSQSFSFNIWVINKPLSCGTMLWFLMINGTVRKNVIILWIRSGDIECWHWVLIYGFWNPFQHKHLFLQVLRWSITERTWFSCVSDRNPE